jgi:diguanylate cyclase (GGDEF)-like protein
MQSAPSQQPFTALKLRVYRSGLLLGALTTAAITLVWWLGRIPIELDDLIAPSMGVFCLASYLLFRAYGVRYLGFFEGAVVSILFGYFLMDFAYVVWREAQLEVIDFGAFELWIPALYIASFLILRSRPALRYSLSYFACILLIGLVYLVYSWQRSVNWHNILHLTQIYASNLVYIAMLFLISVLKDRYGDALVRFEQMHLLAMMDDLTGIYNRRKLNDLLKFFMRDFHEHGRPFSIIMLDVDGLKVINDTYGHAAGDYVLRRVAEILRRNVRDTDQVGRWGGDEFFACYPDTSAEQVRRLARRLAAAVCRASFEGIGQVSLSLGTASVRSADSIESLWKRADRALYLAKRNRRRERAQESDSQSA